MKGLRCRVSGVGFMVQVSGLRLCGSGLRVQGSGFRVQCSGFSGERFRVQGLGLSGILLRVSKIYDMRSWTAQGGRSYPSNEDSVSVMLDASTPPACVYSLPDTAPGVCIGACQSQDGTV